MELTVQNAKSVSFGCQNSGSEVLYNIRPKWTCSSNEELGRLLFSVVSQPFLTSADPTGTHHCCRVTCGGAQITTTVRLRTLVLLAKVVSFLARGND